MATNPAVPFWDEGNTITAVATAAVTGKRFVRVSAARVNEEVQAAHATAAGAILGVSSFDAATGERFTVYSAPGLVMPVTTGAAITAGQRVEVGANGVAVVLAAGIAVGIALDDAANGADCPIKLL